MKWDISYLLIFLFVKKCFFLLHQHEKECESTFITCICIVGSAHHNKWNHPIKPTPQCDAWIAICYLMQDKFAQCSVVWATLENSTTFAVVSFTCRCCVSCVLHIHGPVKKQQFTMTQSRINQTYPDYSMKQQYLQPLSLLCFTTMAVPIERAPLGHSRSNRPISTSHQLCGSLNFSITMQPHS